MNTQPQIKYATDKRVARTVDRERTPLFCPLSLSLSFYQLFKFPNGLTTVVRSPICHRRFHHTYHNLYFHWPGNHNYRIDGLIFGTTTEETISTVPTLCVCVRQRSVD